MNKISIIIATYNAEKYLSHALDSVLRLGFDDWECLIQDGCSTDRTLDIVNEYINKDKRFILQSTCDSGIYDAFNRGLKRAIGEWIYYLGADDEIIADGLHCLLINTNNVDCVYGDVYIRDFNGNVKLFKSKDSNVLPTAMCCSHQAIIMRRSVLNELGGFDLEFKISADYDLLLRAFVSKFRFKRISNCPVAYFSTNGASAKFEFDSIREQYRIYKKNKATWSPILAVSWNFFKRFVRTYIIDPKKIVS